MKFEVPILIEPHHEGGRRLYRARPAFFEGPQASNRDMASATRRLQDKIHGHLRVLTDCNAWGELARWTFAPELEFQNVEIFIDLPKHHFRGHFPLLYFEALGRIVATCPKLDNFWFESETKAHLVDRATEVLHAHFRATKKDDGEAALDSVQKRFAKPTTLWISSVSLNVDIRPRRSSRARQLNWKENLAAQGSGELEKIGRCLDRWYPDSLGEAIRRETLVRRAFRLMHGAARKPVLLVGPSLVGKTALVHAVVRRRVETLERPKHKHFHFRTTWLLSPGRIISGMSTSGEWEHRLCAIVAYAKQNDVILYFDQLLGLLEAGKSAHGDMCVADVLHHHLQRGDVRVIAEANDEQLRLLRERKRAFADLFEIVHVPQPEAADSLRILLHTVRSLEFQHRCRFHPDVVPCVLELTEQFEAETAQPGAAIRRLQDAAVRHAGRKEPIAREDVLEAFREKTGLELAMFRPGKRIDAGEIEEKLRTSIVGQPRAVAAMRDVVLMAESLLSDPKRPIASMLFVGPTGVGKTECAKQLAKVLFGDPARLVRFDANEINTPQAVARLVGTPGGQEGTLTGAIRRRPFCVLLFDEIEKAHPDLFDLLLQVLGEARLTDAMGHVASFAQAIVVCTSNLGVREAASTVGFTSGAASGPTGASQEERDAVYLRAVRDFFRPEWVNRLDRIVPFDPLSDAELERIADSMLDEIMTREGLGRRRCLLNIMPKARQWIVARGHDPRFGARATRRSLERELVAPLSRFLAASETDRPAVIDVRPKKDKTHESGLEIAGQVLEEAPPAPVPVWSEPGWWADQIASHRRAILDAVGESLREMKARLEPLRPSSGFDPTELAPEGRLYFALDERIRDVGEMTESLRIASEERPAEPMLQSAVRRRFTHFNTHRLYSEKRFLIEITASQDIRATLDSWFEDQRTAEAQAGRPAALFESLAELEFYIDPQKWDVERAVLLRLRLPKTLSARQETEPDNAFVNPLATAWTVQPLSVEAGDSAVRDSFAASEYRGPGAAACCRRAHGSELCFFEAQRMGLYGTVALADFDTERPVEDAVRDWLERDAPTWPPVTAVIRTNEAGRSERLVLSHDTPPLPQDIQRLLG